MSEQSTGVSDWWQVRTWRAFDVDPDGRVLAGHDDSGTVQLVELDGQIATPLTALPGSVSGRYVPGRRAVIVSHDNDGDERAQLSLLELGGLDRPAGLRDLVPLVHAEGVMHTLLHVSGDRVAYAHNARNGVDFDVHVRNLRTGSDRAAYTGAGLVQEGVLSLDGRRLALALTSLLPMSAHLVLVELPQDEQAPIPQPVALTSPEQPGRNERLSWTPDGTSLLYCTDSEFDTTLLGAHDLSTGRFRPLVAHDEWDVSGWQSPDGRLLLVQTLVDAESRLGLYDPRTGRQLHQVDLPGAGTADAGVVAYMLPEPVWSPDSSTVTVSFSAPAVPGDVLQVDASCGAVRALTSSATALPGPASRPSSHLVPAPDGENVPCFAYPSTSGPAQERGSCVLLVHGGPEGQSVRTFDPVLQALTASGHAVLVPNVRGSTGYGRRWYSLDDGPRRLDSVADLAAVHAWLPTLGLDQERAALWGGSYGGYMVLAGLAFQPALWAAGVDIVGMSSLVTFLENTSAYRRAFREREYGRLETDRQMLEEASPLTRIDRVRAPLFVIHGANDPRVPLSEAEQVVAAVRANGLECELRVYHDEGHGLAKRANRLDAYPAAIECLARWLR